MRYWKEKNYSYYFYKSNSIYENFSMYSQSFGWRPYYEKYYFQSINDIIKELGLEFIELDKLDLLFYNIEE